MQIGAGDANLIVPLEGVIDIAADAKGVYPLWAMEEGDGALMQIDEDGNLAGAAVELQD